MKIEMVILPRARDGKSTFSSQAEVFMCQRVKMIKVTASTTTRSTTYAPAT